MNHIYNKLAALLLLAVVAIPMRGAHAQFGGFLFVATDETGTSRELTDDAVGLCTVYIVHQGFANDPNPQFAGSRFRVENNGFLGTYLGDAQPYPTLGSSQTGVSISYNACLAQPGVILEVIYLCEGRSGCTSVTLAPDPAAVSGQIEVYDCGAELLGPPVVGELCVNGVLVPDDFIGYCDCPLPVENVTWGKIKAIYDRP
jgi:hypothetical protein